jgi:hypothetical protein
VPDGQPSRKKAKRRGAMGDTSPPLAPAPPVVSARERVLYVGCEGESTEPDYLRWLNQRFGRGERGAPPFRIIPVCKKNGLTPERVVEEVRVEAGADDEAWALFDRDEHTRISQAYDDAAASGTEICFSHPSFDLWLLLHFQDYGGAQSGVSTDIHKKLKKAHPAYRNFDDRNDKSVKGPRAQALEKKSDNAVKRARGLVSQCEHGACKPGQSTVVDAKQRQHDAAAAASGRRRTPERWAARTGHGPTCPVLGRDPSTDAWRLLSSLGITDG